MPTQIQASSLQEGLYSFLVFLFFRLELWLFFIKLQHDPMNRVNRTPITYQYGPSLFGLANFLTRWAYPWHILGSPQQ